MSELAVGDKAKILRKTFLHNGVFVHQNSVVEVASIDGDAVTVAYRDAEGNVINIDGFKQEDLEKSAGWAG